MLDAGLNSPKIPGIMLSRLSIFGDGGSERRERRFRRLSISFLLYSELILPDL